MSSLKYCFHSLFFMFPTDDENITVVDNASLKQGYAGLVSLILEAVKMVSDFSSIRLNRPLNLLMSRFRRAVMGQSSNPPCICNSLCSEIVPYFYYKVIQFLSSKR